MDIQTPNELFLNAAERGHLEILKTLLSNSPGGINIYIIKSLIKGVLSFYESHSSLDIKEPSEEWGF